MNEASDLPDAVTGPVFVLQYDDPAAQDALFVYANSVKKKYPKLAADIKEQIYAAVERAQTFLGELDEIERLGRLHAGIDDGPSLKELVQRPDAVQRYLEGVRLDWEPLDEDVSDHTMFSLTMHADDRMCSYHSRLQSWTFDGDKRCLRTDHPTLPGA